MAAPKMPVAVPSHRVVLGPLKVAFVLFVGAVIGLLATALLLDRRIDPAAVHIGPWVTWPNSGSSEIDPYARAILAQNAIVPLAAAEGLSFTALTDETGAALSARCSYRLDGGVLAARTWTLTASTLAGFPMTNAAGRSGFASSDIVRRDGGGFSIAVGPRARPGNWLPVSGEANFALTLRLYDTSLASNAGELGRATLLSLAKLGCAP